MVFSHPPFGRPQEAKLLQTNSVPHPPSLLVPIDNLQGLESLCVKGSLFGTPSGLAFGLCCTEGAHVSPTFPFSPSHTLN